MLTYSPARAAFTVAIFVSILSGCPQPPVPGCVDSRAENDDSAATEDDGTCVVAESSTYFLDYAQPGLAPGRLPPSACDALQSHQECVTTEGCGLLRAIGGEGVCRGDPVARCLADGSCVCNAYDFHGDPNHETDLEIFVPLAAGIGTSPTPRSVRADSESDASGVRPGDKAAANGRGGLRLGLEGTRPVRRRLMS